MLRIKAKAAVVMATIFFLSGIAVEAATVPYNTIVNTGQVDAARHLYGEKAAIGSYDANWLFSSIQAYEDFFRVESQSSCDEECVENVIHSMRPLVRTISVGTEVRVVKIVRDPEDARYRVCKIIGGASGWIICDALAE